MAGLFASALVLLLIGGGIAEAKPKNRFDCPEGTLQACLARCDARGDHGAKSREIERCRDNCDKKC